MALYRNYAQLTRHHYQLTRSLDNNVKGQVSLYYITSDTVHSPDQPYNPLLSYSTLY